MQEVDLNSNEDRVDEKDYALFSRQVVRKVDHLQSAWLNVLLKTCE